MQKKTGSSVPSVIGLPAKEQDNGDKRLFYMGLKQFPRQNPEQNRQNQTWIISRNEAEISGRILNVTVISRTVLIAIHAHGHAPMDSRHPASLEDPKKVVLALGKRIQKVQQFNLLPEKTSFKPGTCLKLDTGKKPSKGVEMRIMSLAILSFICLFTLSGCIDVQMDFDLRHEQLDVVTRQRTIDDEFAPRPNEKCEEQGGTLTTLPNGDTRCHHTTPFSLDDWLQQGRVSFTDIGDRQKTQSMNVSVEEVDTDRLRLTMDVNAFVTEIHQQYFPPDMPPVFKESFVQKAKENLGEDGFHITFTGEQVESTNGQLSADGKKVTFFVPLSDIVEPEKKTSPDRYTALIRTEPIPEGLTAPVTFNDPETRAFINTELAPYLPAGWQAVVVAAAISGQDVTLASHYILNDQPHKFTLPDERKPKAALLKLHRQMVDDGLGWQKALITLMPDGSLKLEPLS